MSEIRAKSISSIGLVIILIITGWIYSQGVNGPFVLDDNWNVVDNETLRIDVLTTDELYSASFSREAGFLRRPISMMTFALNYYFTGEETAGFKWVNIVIHLISGVLVFLFSLWLAEAWRKIHRPQKPVWLSYLLAFSVSGLWLLHPLNVSTVLYIVQRQTELSAMFMFLGLAMYMKGRLRLIDSGKGSLMIILSVTLCTALAAFSKENGLLLIFLIALCELVILQFNACNDRMSRRVKMLFALYAGLPLLAGLLLFNVKISSMLNFSYRDFSMMERLLTEGRVLMFYLRQIIFPDITQMGLMHDGIVISKNWFEPLQTGPAVMACFALLGLALVFVRKLALLSFCILFFFMGHSLESTIFPLELVFEHRNYLPMAGILLLLVAVALRSFSLKPAVGFILLLLSFFAWQTQQFVKDWSSIDRYFLSAVKYHPESPRAHQGAAGLYFMIMQNNEVDRAAFYKKIKAHYQRAYELKPSNGVALIKLLRVSWLEKQPVDPDWAVAVMDSYRQKMTLSKLRSLKVLVNCEVDKECQFGRDYMGELFDTVLTHSAFGHSRIRAMAGKYYQSIDEVDQALEYMEKCLSPGVEHAGRRVRYGQLLLKKGRVDAAKAALEHARQDDKYGDYKKEIAELEHQLSQ